MRTFLLILSATMLWLVYAPPPIQSYLLPIRIALTIDENSFKDLLLVINSIRLTAYQPKNLTFHIAAAGIDMSGAVSLKTTIELALLACFADLSYEIVPFVLPPESGFAHQLVSVKRRSHWYSPTGADMVRFFLAKIFPNAGRLLYLDNDVIVTCCLEEIWATDLGVDKVIGIALDDLKWATVTQFQRQYNATHPLVIKNIRRKAYASATPVLEHELSEDEFWKALPRYPNDGVLLIDVNRYNQLHILDAINDIALANGKGEYVVGLGTQQFTVLGLHDRWVELSPRANLRHFPDMARGYLMWFLYHGFLHYAGQSKPRAICNNGFSENGHRMHTYTAWAYSAHDLYLRCPAEKSLQAEACAGKHVLSAPTFADFMSLLITVVQRSRDTSLLYLRIGALTGSEFDRASEIVTQSQTQSQSQSSQSYSRQLLESGEMVRAVDLFLLHNASWSARVLDQRTAQAVLPAPADHDHPLSSQINFSAALKTSTDKLAADALELLQLQQQAAAAAEAAQSKRKGAKKQFSNKPAHSPANEARVWSSHQLHFCLLLSPLVPGHPRHLHEENCVNILNFLNTQKKRHWDVMAVTVDYQPSLGHSQLSSLAALRALDLEFFRPRLILVRIGPRSYPCNATTVLRHSWLQEDAQEAMVLLQRSGYMANLYAHDDIKDSRHTIVAGVRLTTLSLVQ